MFVKYSQGFVVMPRIWNFDELFEAMTLIQTKNRKIPIILVGRNFGQD
jgi:predicted Rossmann-fold nucleotide-binding protein